MMKTVQYGDRKIAVDTEKNIMLTSINAIAKGKEYQYEKVDCTFVNRSMFYHIGSLC